MARTTLEVKQQPGGLYVIEDAGTSTGSRWFVSSGTGTDGAGYGQSPDSPVATVDYAIGLCTADKHDIIYVMPGHTEDITAAATITADAAGIRIVGLGTGSDRPTFTLKTNAAATIAISAANVTVENCLFVCGLDGLNTAFTVTGDDLAMRRCEFRDPDDVECDIWFTLTGSDRTVFDRCLFNGFITGNQQESAIDINTCYDVLVDKCIFHGKYATGAVNIGTASFQLTVRDCAFRSGTTSNFSLTVVDTATGSTFQAINCFDLYAGCGFSGSSQTALAADDVSAVAALIGTLTNTAGTATLGGILGDVANSSIATRLTNIYNAIAKQGAFAWGVADAGTNSTTIVPIAGLAGYGTDFFNGHFYMQILLNANSATNAPEDQIRQITDYVTATGTFTCSAFGAAVEASDICLILHESAVILGEDNADNAFASTNVVANADGSLIERLQYIQAEADKISSAAIQAAPTANSLARFVASGGTALGTPLADSKSLVDALGTNGTTVADTATGIAGMIGVNDADNAMLTDAVVSNADGSVYERLELVQSVVGPTVDIVTTDSLHGKLGTDTEMNDRSIYDLINGGGPATAATAARAANNISLYAALRLVGNSAPMCVDGKSLTSIPTTSDVGVWSITGGPVWAQVYGIVTTVLVASCTARWRIVTTNPAATVELNAGAVAIDNDAAGTTYYNVGANSTFTPGATLGAIILDQVTVEPTWFFLGPGAVNISLVSAAGGTGVIAFYMRYIPLSPSSIVASA